MPLYPTQIMMSIASLVGFVLLRYVVYPWRGRPLGAVAAWYIVYESFSRFLIDFWRGDRPVMGVSRSVLALSFYQYVAVLVICAGLGALVILHYHVRRR